MSAQNITRFALSITALSALGIGAGWPFDPLAAHFADAKQAQPEELEVTIKHCHDGDTCTATTPRRGKLRIRFVGIDAPEVGDEKKKGQPHAEASRDALRTAVEGKPVLLRIWNKDKYGRSLAEVFINQININIWLVREGHAEVYRGKIEEGVKVNSYLDAEAEAKREKKGIWNRTDYESPRRFRKAHAKLKNEL